MKLVEWSDSASLVDESNLSPGGRQAWLGPATMLQARVCLKHPEAGSLRSSLTSSASSQYAIPLSSVAYSSKGPAARRHRAVAWARLCSSEAVLELI